MAVSTGWQATYSIW